MDQAVKLPSDNQSILPASEKAHLRDYIPIIRKRKLSILSVMVSTVFGTTLYVLMQQPIYESTVSLLIEPTGPNVMSKAVEEVYAPIDINFDYYKTQYEILKSHEIMRETVKRLNLKTHPEYGPRPASLLDSWLAEVKKTVMAVLKSVVTTPAGPQGPEPDSEAERLLVDAFRQHVKVSPVMNSRIVRVTVESIDPQLAAQAANTIASVYITRSLEMKTGAAQEASKWITARVEELRQKVEASERNLQEFASRYGLVNVDERRRLTTQKLGELNSQLVQAETKRVEAEARFKQIASVLDNPSELESSQEVLSSSLIQTLRNQEIQLAQKVAELSDKYGAKHPTLMQAQSELKEVQGRIRLEIRKIYSAVKGEYEVAMARERVVRNALNQQKTDVMAMGQHEVQYSILDREAQSNRQLYEMFLKRLKETNISTDIKMSNIYVADPAIVSLVPIKPNKSQAILLAIVLGLVGGVGFAFFLDYMDSSLKSPEDIAHYLPGVPYLGFLPVYQDSGKSAGRVDIAAHEAPQSVFAENLRSIRTSLFLSAADKPPSSILVTSSTEDEGKSTLAVNLAISIAQLGNRTVLVDADLRKPRLHKTFGLDVTKGLSHYLVGEVGLQEIMLPTSIPNLKIIPCGAVPPNPAELLQSNHMMNLLESFKKDDIYVIVDSSPVMAVTDPVVLGHRVDGVVLVVWAGHTNRHAARLSAQLLIKGNIRLLGVVLQRLKRGEMSVHYSHYYYYPYYRSKYYREKPPKANIDRA
jgi:polysaccharide biosynthesis transport protein